MTLQGRSNAGAQLDTGEAFQVAETLIRGAVRRALLDEGGEQLLADEVDASRGAQ